MKTQTIKLTRYDADDGKVFDWAEPRYEDGVQVHLYAKTLFIGSTDTIDNYIEVEAVTNETNEDT